MKLPKDRWICPNCGSVLLKIIKTCPLCLGSGVKEKISAPELPYSSEKTSHIEGYKPEWKERFTNYRKELRALARLSAEEIKPYLATKEDAGERIKHRKRLMKQLKDF